MSSDHAHPGTTWLQSRLLKSLAPPTAAWLYSPLWSACIGQSSPPYWDSCVMYFVRVFTVLTRQFWLHIDQSDQSLRTQSTGHLALHCRWTAGFVVTSHLEGFTGYSGEKEKWMLSEWMSLKWMSAWVCLKWERVFKVNGHWRVEGGGRRGRAKGATCKFLNLKKKFLAPPPTAKSWERPWWVCLKWVCGCAYGK